jgi:hypothetical protein
VTTLEGYHQGFDPRSFLRRGSLATPLPALFLFLTGAGPPQPIAPIGQTLSGFRFSNQAGVSFVKLAFLAASQSWKDDGFLEYLLLFQEKHTALMRFFGQVCPSPLLLH